MLLRFGVAGFLEPLVSAPFDPHRLLNARTGATVARSVTAALDSRSRRKGLLGKDAAAEGDALVLAPCEAIHTCFMRFPIDVAFVADDGRVVRVVRALRPWRAAGAFSAFATVEMAAGSLADTKAGDVLVMTSAA